MTNYNWFCFKTVLPKKEYKFVGDINDFLSFYKDGEPIVVLQKAHTYHPTYTNTILNRLNISQDEFANLLRLCQTQPQS